MSGRSSATAAAISRPASRRFAALSGSEVIWITAMRMGGLRLVTAILGAWW